MKAFLHRIDGAVIQVLVPEDFPQEFFINEPIMRLPQYNDVNLLDPFTPTYQKRVFKAAYLTQIDDVTTVAYLERA